VSRRNPAAASTRPTNVSATMGVPSNGQDASAVIAGTTNSRLLARVAPCLLMRWNSSSGPPMPATVASQTNEPTARAVSGIARSPCKGAQTAMTAVPAAISTAGSA
jgi:hypothetical protein